MNTNELIQIVTDQEKIRHGKQWPLCSLFHSFKYSTVKGFNKDKILLVASDFTFTDNGEYCYFAQNKQVNQSYYIKVIRISDLKYDLITYCDSKIDAKETIKRIKNNSQFNNPEAIKYSFYCGSGSNSIYWFDNN